MSLDDLLPLLACPRDHAALTHDGDTLTCPDGHTYRVFDGIPILLRDDVSHTHWLAERALESARTGQARDLSAQTPPGAAVDAYVQESIGATGGLMYEPLAQRLQAYPIPRLPLPDGGGRTLLDVGTGWGRWAIAAARAGYRAIGCDPGLDGVLAARRVCRQLGVKAGFVVGDARHLPFRTGALDTAFSYSVIQHFSRPDATAAFTDIGRVLAPGGRSRVQMPNRYGLRCLYVQARRGFRDGDAFEVRYWSPGELQRLGEAIGPTSLSVDGFFSLNPRMEDLALLPRRFRAVVRVSDALRRLAAAAPRLRQVADSLWVDAVRG
jgi:SAM-dependent methyltransferase/uncharacterized protein YbaR (Trm112 family)